MFKYNWSENINDKYELYLNPIGINFELNEFQIAALEKLIRSYLECSKTHFYTLAGNRKNRLRFICENASLIKYFDKRDIIDIKSNFMDNVHIHICLNIDTFSHLEIYSYLSKENDLDLTRNQKNTNLKKILHTVEIDVVQLISYSKNVQIAPNYYLINVEIMPSRFNGYYDFNWIQLDFGAPVSIFQYNQMVKCKIKYYIITLNQQMPFSMDIDTMNLFGNITLSLIQLFLRTPIDVCIKHGEFREYPNEEKLGDHELNTSHIGVLSSHVRDVTDMKSSSLFNNDFGIPEDMEDLLNKFYSLDYNKKNIFISSCRSYVRALKHYSIEAVTYYTIAIENIATYEASISSNKSKQKIIVNLFEDIFDNKIDAKEFIEYFYTIRSKYVHQGIYNDSLKGEILGIEYVDSILVSEIEKITHIILVKWLNRQGDTGVTRGRFSCHID